MDQAARGALPPLSPAEQAAMPGRVRGFVWPTEFLMLADFLEATPHHHSALQLMVGIEAPIRVDTGTGWQEVAGVLVGTDVEHGLDGTRGLMGGGWVEAESRLGARLRDRVLGDAPWIALEVDAAAAVAAEFAPCLDRATGCAEAHRRWRAGVTTLLDEPLEEPAVDGRVRAVLDHLQTVPTPPPGVDELATIAHLSTSRLQHLFSEQVGVPIRRYLLWQRVLSAMGLMAEGASATEAAHAAGFADSAHLSRTTRRMNGVTPTDMEPIAAWLSNCR